METGQSQATLSATPIRLPPGSWRSLATLVIGAGYHPVTDLTCLLFTIETKLNKRTLTAGVALPVKPAGNASPSPNPVPRSPVYTHTPWNPINACHSALRAGAHMFQSVFLHIIFDIKQHPEQLSSAMHTTVCANGKVGIVSLPWCK